MSPKNIGGKHCAMINIRGKSLSLVWMLVALEYENCVMVYVSVYMIYVCVQVFEYWQVGNWARDSVK